MNEAAAIGVTTCTIEQDTLATFKRPGWRYWLLLLGAVAGTAVGGYYWGVMLHEGLGMTGMDAPVMWGSFIASFVFFIGISHSGTLISAILYFTRSPLRASIGRSAEAMTVIAILTAGLYPVIHLGRSWLFFWLLPYANQRGLWPNFHSPLIWDLFAVCCYVTISMLFLYMGMIPDLAILSKRVKGWRRLLYKTMSLGFSGTDSEWNIFKKAYPIFAAVAIPLAVSVHSVVSWDFGMTLLPGWHSTIFAPYFVAGAIFQGLAMAILLLAGLRVGFKLQAYIQVKHFVMMAKLLVAMSLVMTFVYTTEFVFAMYRGTPTEKAIFEYRVLGYYGWVYWAVILCNCVIPLIIFSKKVRRSIGWMAFVGVIVTIGMWLERFLFVVSSLAHQFDPYTWHDYMPSWREMAICMAGFAWFLMLFLIFVKIFPSISVAETLERVHTEAAEAKAATTTIPEI